MKKQIYFDYAATTPVDPRVTKFMLPYFNDNFGNTASAHSYGVRAAFALQKSREIIAKTLNCLPEEVFFTASATESNNTILKGVAWAYKDKGKHLIISAIEHDCVLGSAAWLERQGFEISRINVDKDGLIDLSALERAIKKDTILVSVMHANNEIGTIQPIEKIGRICRQKKTLFHTDASQSFGKIPIDVKKANIDFLTASSHKLYGPKGAALLYKKKNILVEPLLHGGGHEFGLRSSTVNVASVVGFAKAVDICLKEQKSENKRLISLRDKLIARIIKKIPASSLNGHPQLRLPNNINVRFDAVEGEAVMLGLDEYGIAVSTGSACSSNNLQPSHVLKAIGLRPGQIHGSIRISLGRWTKEGDIDRLLQVLPKVVRALRKVSPFWKEQHV